LLLALITSASAKTLTFALLKGMKSLTGVLKPVAQLQPRWLPADQVLSLVVV